MSQKRQAQVPDVELQQECHQDQESTNKRARGAEDKEQQQQDPGLDLDCKDSINLPPLPAPPQDDDPIITQFTPVEGQWELSDDNIKRIDPTTGETILHNYCHHINTTPLEVYRYLIETKGCDVNARGNATNSPLHYALYYFDPRNGGDITVLMYLLGHENVNANLKDGYGNTLLHEACDNINKLPVDVFKVLIETHGFDINNIRDHDIDAIPLHCAFDHFNPDYGGDITVLRYLLSQCNVEAGLVNDCDVNLLHRACKKINRLPLDIFKTLIETLCCDISASEYDTGYTPLHYAFECFNPDNGGDITILKYLVSQWDRECGQSILHIACSYINGLPLDIFKFLIETHGNAKDDYHDILIDSAFECFDPRRGGDVNVLLYLLSQKNIDANRKHRYGQTLLHSACENINTLPLDVFKLLIETLGCDVNIQDNNKKTPLHRALDRFNPRWGDINVLFYLLNQKNLDANIKGYNGQMLLHSACLGNLFSRNSSELNAENDTIVCQIVKIIVERRLEQVLDDTAF
jgi:ankyrin repeat protein